ncbi:hypothetical protein F0224_03585 [Vibrio coralliilyticus]|uniref:hypothetical protein n=1 Tax=Vibrio coralliilyticus TaxID=190893 RepID=UPI000BAC1C4E|nr:hypothetical protein [Vibrio coralliilyticus]NOI74748.1 hypothetical protein [Vibrio coralliilyticus]PAW05333.1 hypothetical protein CKJ79_03590 [Vibrio coralliilyticus]
MEQGVLDILSYFSKAAPTKRNQLRTFMLNNKLEFGAVSAAISFFMMSILLAIFFDSKIEALYLLLACFSMLALYSFSSAITTLKSILYYRNETLTRLVEQYKVDCSHVSELSGYEISSLKATQELIQSRISFINKRIGFIVGAIEKLGIVPALFMMYVTYREISSEPSNDNFHIMFASLIVGVYIGAILARVTVDYLEDNLNIIQLTIDKKSVEVDVQSDESRNNDG